MLPWALCYFFLSDGSQKNAFPKNPKTCTQRKMLEKWKGSLCGLHFSFTVIA